MQKNILFSIIVKIILFKISIQSQDINVLAKKIVVMIKRVRVYYQLINNVISDSVVQIAFKKRRDFLQKNNKML